MTGRPEVKAYAPAWKPDPDLGAAAARLRRSGFPGVDQYVEQRVLHPPSEEQMLATYGKVDGRAT